MPSLMLRDLPPELVQRIRDYARKYGVGLPLAAQMVMRRGVDGRVPQYIQCANCGKDVTVLFEPAGYLESLEPATEQPWDCPHRCGYIERPTLHGRIVAVWAGHTSEPAGTGPHGASPEARKGS